jgi:hypothetical protein
LGGALHYLIDGHNLIARSPDLSLSDPEDEAKLVARLKRWAGRDVRRRVTVVFDAGLPGGPSRSLSGGRVTVIFAPNNTTADAILIGRISRAHNPPEMTVVSSDTAVLDAAARRRMPAIRADVFAVELASDAAAPKAVPGGKPGADDPRPSPKEVEEWLAIFGPEPETKPRPPAGRPRKPRP